MIRNVSISRLDCSHLSSVVMQEAYRPTTANKANPSCPTGDSKVIEVGLHIGETLPSLFCKVAFLYYIYILILSQKKKISDRRYI